MRLLHATALAAALLLGSAADAMLGDRWPVVGFDHDESCELTLRSNPIAIHLDAGGFIPAETLHVTIRNGDMKPLAATLRASASGRISEYYAPRKTAYAPRPFGQPQASPDGSGLVEIELAASRCTLKASAPWSFDHPTIL